MYCTMQTEANEKQQAGECPSFWHQVCALRFGAAAHPAVVHGSLALCAAQAAAADRLNVTALSAFRWPWGRGWSLSCRSPSTAANHGDRRAVQVRNQGQGKPAWELQCNSCASAAWSFRRSHSDLANWESPSGQLTCTAPAMPSPASVSACRQRAGTALVHAASRVLAESSALPAG